MAKRKSTAEEIVTVLRQVEVAIGHDNTTPQAGSSCSFRVSPS
jgi:hypothetical protein